MTGGAFPPKGAMVDIVGDADSIEIAHRLARHQFAVVAHAAANVDRIELVRDACRASLELSAPIAP
jgi:hypothetical protein